MKRILLLLAIISSAKCASVGDESTLRVTSGTPEAFCRASCVSVDTAADSDAQGDFTNVLYSYLSDIASLPQCIRDGSPEILVLQYQVGDDVCIDCDASIKAERTGFALLSVTSDDSQISSAEWQYSQGSNPRNAAKRFAADLGKLRTSCKGSSRVREPAN